ncbi:PDZ domain-containing protein [Planctomycetota bacterium]
MRQYSAGILLLCLLLYGAAVAEGDVIELIDGMRIKVRVMSETDDAYLIKRFFKDVTLKKSLIKQVFRSDWKIELAHGITFTGKIMEETPDSLRVQTPMQAEPIVLAKSDILKYTEHGVAAAVLEVKHDLTPEILNKLHLKAQTHWRKNEGEKALDVYERILKAYPQDSHALYNTACQYALAKRPKKALRYLRNSIEWGFIDFGHIEKDTDLDGLRELDGYKEVMDNRSLFILQSQSNTVHGLRQQLMAQGVWIDDYDIDNDPGRMLTFIYSMPARDFKTIKSELAAYAAAQWKHLFTHKPGSPLYVVILSRQDTRKVLKGIGGVFFPRANMLLCGASGHMALMGSNVIRHEFTHALHYGDMARWHQGHPIWMVEGLATLFESCDLIDGRPVPRHSYRLQLVRKAAQRGSHIAWKDMIRMDYLSFMRRAGLCYSQARYMMFYIHSQGKLKEFYKAFTLEGSFKPEERAEQAFKQVFGKTAVKLEKDWLEWLFQQEVPKLPFLGIEPRRGPTEVQIAKIRPGSGAQAAGLQIDDIIVNISGSIISNWDDLQEALSHKKPGETVSVTVKRGDEEVTVSVELNRSQKTEDRGPIPEAKLTR